MKIIVFQGAPGIHQIGWMGLSATLVAIKEKYISVSDGIRTPIPRSSDEVRNEGVGWIHLVRDIVQWWALVHTVMNLRIFHD
jgi:hypothetical protein